MSKRMLFFVASIGAAALPATAHAQTRVSSMAIAECVVELDASHVAKLLNTLPGSLAEEHAKHVLLASYRTCMNISPSRELEWRDRAELAVAAVNRQTSERRPDYAAGVLRADWAMPDVKQVFVDPKLIAMRRFGECIVKAAPIASAKLVRADPGTSEENAAIEQLTPAISGCVSTDQTIKIKRDQLRLLVAEPIYHAITR